MKKILLIIFVFLLLGIGFLSCSTVEDCPAYGQLSNTEDIKHKV